MKKVELKSKSKTELENLLKGDVKKLQELRFDLTFNRLKNISEVKKVKRGIALIKTLLNQK